MQASQEEQRVCENALGKDDSGMAVHKDPLTLGIWLRLALATYLVCFIRGCDCLLEL